MPPWQDTLSIGADDVGFHSTVGRPIARVTISCLCLRFVLIFKGNVLEIVNVLISKKRAYF